MKKFLLLFTLVTLVSFYGCDKDDDPVIIGCTDSEAVNYNPEATENEGCVYRKDLFLGAYVGTIDCEEELLNDFFGEEEFEFIVNEIPGENDSVIIQFNLGPVEGEPEKAFIDENHILRSENTVDGIEVDVTMDGNPDNVRITTIVELMKVEDSKDLEGTLTIEVEIELFGTFVPVLTDECDLTAVWVE
nr:hypothetical protein [Saprospiraceae bacterium]